MDKPNRTADKAHQDNNNRVEALTRLLYEFGRTVAENNCRTLIYFLKDVIREFNKKIRAVWRELQVTEQSDWTIPRLARYRQQEQQITSQNMARPRKVSIGISVMARERSAT